MKDKITLKKIVEENKSLLTVAGVFAALTAFFFISFRRKSFHVVFHFCLIFITLCGALV
jgi:LPXTG-motif cell wall-anchored protein